MFLLNLTLKLWGFAITKDFIFVSIVHVHKSSYNFDSFSYENAIEIFKKVYLENEFSNFSFAVLG